MFAERGDQIVVIGLRGHAALTALLDGLSVDVVVVESADQIRSLRLAADRVSYVVQPGMLIGEAARVVAALRAHYPRVRGAHPDGLCYAASDHAATVSAVATSCDTTFILGEVTHPDTSRPLMLAAAQNVHVHVIDDIAQIRPSWIAGAGSVGIVSTQSAQRNLECGVLDFLSGLGPLSVVRRRLVTEVLTSWSGDCLPALAQSEQR